jgi:Leucine-rich repeat (LRR) protein
LVGQLPALDGTALTTLEISNNLFTGLTTFVESPPAGLTELWGYSNAFIGTIPSSIGKIKQLQNLDLQESQFTGAIPSEIGLMSNLLFIRLGSNTLTSTIPASLGTLLNLGKIPPRLLFLAC